MVFYRKLTVKNLLRRNVISLFAGAFFFCAPVYGQDFGQAGITLLRDLNTNLNGAGIRVGQPEGPEDQAGMDWEVAPGSVGQPTNLFTYISDGDVSTNFPNSLGGESSHADSVGWNFYDLYTGVATNVAHVDNYNANYFAQETEEVIGEVTNYTCSLPASNIWDSVVNQSYIFADYVDGNWYNCGSNEQAAIDSAFDTYAVQYGVLFVSGAGDGVPTYVSPPSTCYNGISVGVYEGAGSSPGPTVDNGRCKPDITAVAPGDVTSFSCPYVAGSAAILLQAAQRGDGGTASCATNMTTLKALLLNGAVKPPDWTNIPPSPLDFRYGSGVLNVFNSYEELTFGRHVFNFSTNVPMGTAHPPVVMSGSVPVLSGWDFDTNASSSSGDGVNHYFFNVTNSSRSGTFALTATLVWNRHKSKTAINNLALYLYNVANSNLVAASTSVVDNVQQVFVPQLAQGRYDLEVWKAGGGSIVSTKESYALAWQAASESLGITSHGTNFFLSWPAYPAGFAVAAASSLSSPISWSTNNIPAPVYTNGENLLWLSATNSAEFFRLQTPNF